MLLFNIINSQCTLLIKKDIYLDQIQQLQIRLKFKNESILIHDQIEKIQLKIFKFSCIKTRYFRSN